MQISLEPSGEYSLFGDDDFCFSIDAIPEEVKHQEFVLAPRFEDSTFDSICEYYESSGIGKIFFERCSGPTVMEFCRRNSETLTHVIAKDDLATKIKLLDNLRNLKCLEIINSTLTPQIEEIERHFDLETLAVVKSNNLFSNGIPRLPNLKSLVLQQSRVVNSFEFMDCVHLNFPSLERMVINMCQVPTHEAVGSREGCQEFDLGNLRHLPRFNLDKFQAVGTKISENANWAKIRDYNKRRNELESCIESLDEDASTFETSNETFHKLDFETLHDYVPNLSSISLHGSKDVDDLSDLMLFANLTSLKLKNCDGFASLESIRGNGTIQELIIDSCDNIQNIGSLSDLPCLQKLELLSCNKIANYAIQFSETIRSIKVNSSNNKADWYKSQLVNLWETLPFETKKDFDVSEDDLLAIVEGHQRYKDLVCEELEDVLGGS